MSITIRVNNAGLSNVSSASCTAEFESRNGDKIVSSYDATNVAYRGNAAELEFNLRMNTVITEVVLNPGGDSKKFGCYLRDDNSYSI